MVLSRRVQAVGCFGSVRAELIVVHCDQDVCAPYHLLLPPLHEWIKQLVN